MNKLKKLNGKSLVLEDGTIVTTGDLISIEASNGKKHYGRVVVEEFTRYDEECLYILSNLTDLDGGHDGIVENYGRSVGYKYAYVITPPFAFSAYHCRSIKVVPEHSIYQIGF
jgi:hypothetical protein